MEPSSTPTQCAVVPPLWLLTLDTTITVVNFVAPLLGQIAWFSVFFAAVTAPLDANIKAVSAFELRLAGVALSVPAGVFVARVLGHWLLEGVVAPKLCYRRMRWLEEDGARRLAEKKAGVVSASVGSRSSVSAPPNPQVRDIASSSDGMSRPASPADSTHDLSPLEEMQRQDFIRQWQAGL